MTSREDEFISAARNLITIEERRGMTMSQFKRAFRDRDSSDEVKKLIADTLARKP